MWEKFKTRRILKKGRTDAINEEFIVNFRHSLKEYMAIHPVSEDVVHIFIKKFNFASLVPALIVALLVIFSGGGVTLAAQGSTPGEKLYPVKLFSEEVRMIMSPRAEKRAKLQTLFAEKRIKELEKILEGDKVETDDLNEIMSRLEAHIALASKIIDEEELEGNDVLKLAGEINGRINKVNKSFKDVFKNKRVKLKDLQTQLQQKINEATQNNDQDLADKLSEEEDILKKEEIILETGKDVTSENLKEKEDNIESKMDEQIAAQDAINEAQEEKVEFMNLFKDFDNELVQQALVKYDDFFKKADEALASQHFVQARQHASQAERSLLTAERELKRIQWKMEKKNDRVKKIDDEEIKKPEERKTNLKK